MKKHTPENCPVCATRELFEREGIKHESVIFPCRRDGTARFVWFGPVPKNEREADRLIIAFRRAFGITKTPGRKKTLNLLLIEQTMHELPGTATPQVVADYLGVSKKTLERYLAVEWVEPFHDLQARIKGKPKPSRLKKKLQKGKTRKKMF